MISAKNFITRSERGDIAGLSNEVRKKLRTSALKYLKSRQNFLRIANESDWLTGNDNLIGRIGEFIAFQYLNDSGRNPKRPKSKTQKGYDLLCNNQKKISVKMITSENESGSTTRISEPWDELILISIGSDLRVEKMGILTKKGFERALNDGHISSKAPKARKSMLEEKGLIGKYGTIIEIAITKNFL